MCVSTIKVLNDPKAIFDLKGWEAVEPESLVEKVVSVQRVER